MFSPVRILLVLLIAVLSIGSLEAAKTQRYYEVAEDSLLYPGLCYDPHMRNAYKIGDTYTNAEQCYKAKCILRNDKRVLEKESCDTTRRLEDYCKRTSIDASKRFPDCCPIVQCEPVKIQY